MCVIFLVNKARPSEEMVKRAFDHNKDGVGAGWRDGGYVMWKKGITNVDEAVQLAADLPLPYVMHFRVASVGGVKQSLTHPFPITRDVDLSLRGRTKGAVLFHNGHWNPWNDRVLEAAIHANQRIPPGPDWSDTRAMAWMTHIYGPGFMNLLTSQKGIILTPGDMEIFTGGGWDKINEVWCSNDYFWGRGRHVTHGGFHQNYGGRLCSVGKCQNRAQVGKDFCTTCEKDRTPDLSATSGDAADSEDHTLEIVTGGAKRPLARIFTLKEMEDMYKGKTVSKSQYKKYRKFHGILGQGGKKEIRALAQLEAVTRTVAERIATGLSV